jgi:cytochrome b6-f complex iron-sulfur subunit
MDTTTALLIAIPVLVVLAGVVLFASARRRDTGEAIGALARETRKRDRGSVAVLEGDEAAPVTGREVERAAAIEQRESGKGLATVGATAPVPWVPPDPEALDVTRRQFMNRGIVTFFGLGLAGFGGSMLAFLWPQLGEGFGGVINLGSTSDVDTKIEEGDGFAYYPEGRMWVTHYPSAALGAARAVYSPPEVESMEAGYTALYQKCVHLGCRVPQCLTSQWFECQCHGSQYNRNGEKKGGPAPRGLDRFPLTVSGGRVSVDTAPDKIITGPPIGTNTTGQEAEGPHCVGGGEH